MFRFKQFNVDQTGCAMKINTDGVLLGALAAADNAATLLDIGTGTGVIALMLAQRFTDAQIDAVEIDGTAAVTAGNNFAGSPFADRLTIYPSGFKEFFEQYPDKRYDFIVSNPPFHINSLASTGDKKNLARHTDEYFFEELIGHVSQHLTGQGSCWLILPLPTAELVKQLIAQYKMHLQKTISILSYPGSDPHREILVLTLEDKKGTDERFVIYDEPKVYSTQYQEALGPFFTIFQ